MTTPYTKSVGSLAAVTLVAALATGCGGATRAPAPERAPSAAEAHHPPTPAGDSARRGYTAADVRFMHHMMHHHTQALAMTALVPARTGRADLRLLAERIEVSQQDEIALMAQWLRSRGEEVPDVDGRHAGQGHHGSSGSPAMPPMPGMLGAEELARLTRATGPEFDRLFLQLMIRHHEGALVMLQELFSAPGAAQDPQVYSLATDVDADQRAEIRRMRALLGTLTGAPPSR